MDTTHRMEILKLARDIVNNEYADQRAQDHNKWLADSEMVWRSHKLKLPYPKFPKFPTEEVIVERAKVLLDFLNEGNTNIKPSTQCEPTAITEQQEKQQEQHEELSSVEQIVNQQSIEHEQDTPLQTNLMSVPSDSIHNSTSVDVVEYMNAKTSRNIDDNCTSLGRILPSVLKNLKSRKVGFS